MNLVPENINEIIKHLSPKTSEEAYKNYSDFSIYLEWRNAALTNAPEALYLYNELKRRNAKYASYIPGTGWYFSNKHRINEAIKHLGGRSNKEIIANFPNDTDQELFDLWNAWETDIHLSIACIEELKNRDAIYFLKKVKRSLWFEEKIKLSYSKLTSKVKQLLKDVNIDEDKINLFYKTNESIKHLSGKTKEEALEYLDPKIKKMYEDINKYFKQYNAYINFKAGSIDIDLLNGCFVEIIYLPPESFLKDSWTVCFYEDGNYKKYVFNTFKEIKQLIKEYL